MGENDTRGATITVSWREALDVIHDFLDSTYVLPTTMTDFQLTNLMTACRNARKRLAEKRGG